VTLHRFPSVCDLCQQAERISESIQQRFNAPSTPGRKIRARCPFLHRTFISERRRCGHAGYQRSEKHPPVHQTSCSIPQCSFIFDTTYTRHGSHHAAGPSIGLPKRVAHVHLPMRRPALCCACCNLSPAAARQRCSASSSISRNEAWVIQLGSRAWNDGRSSEACDQARSLRAQLATVHILSNKKLSVNRHAYRATLDAAQRDPLRAAPLRQPPTLAFVDV